MQNHYSIIASTLMIVLTAGCATAPNRVEVPKDAAKMAVDFSWEGIEACTHESPEIRVTGIPDGTKTLQVKLTNIKVPQWNQGGGIVNYDGMETVPAGALKLGYNGPCPPPGQRYNYEFSVAAVDADGTIIGFGKSRQPFPPKK